MQFIHFYESFIDCSLKLALTYDSEKQTYTSEEGCWTKADANIKIEACSSFALGFIQCTFYKSLLSVTHTIQIVKSEIDDVEQILWQKNYI